MSTKEPRLFALTRPDDDADQIIGYGLALPDGSAFSISWPTRLGSSIFSTSSAEENADVRGADLMWIGHQ